MNETLQKFARNTLKAGFAQCTLAQQLMFKRMYSHNLELPLESIVDAMPEEKLDWAMVQVERALQLKNESEAK